MRKLLVDGHAIDAREVYRDLHRLLAYLIAEPDLERRWPPDADHPLGEKLRNAEIGHSLVRIAAAVRAELDRSGEGDLEECGLMIRSLSITDPRAGEEEVMHLREACNKILHADAVQFGAEHDYPNPGERMPVLTLFGAHNGKQWFVRISPFALADAVVRRLRSIKAEGN